MQALGLVSLRKRKEGGVRGGNGNPLGVVDEDERGEVSLRKRAWRNGDAVGLVDEKEGRMPERNRRGSTGKERRFQETTQTPI